MAHNPKLNVYIISLKPKKQDENKTFRDFFDQQTLGEGKGRIYTADEQGRNANYDISKDIQSITYHLSFG
ncbi:hypothetical protein [Bacteroides heparinolyticus]|uniref:hypothetical protein n=1 Tax=Prevotella heparinolytica TaxID=28113 RepID=UPI003AF178B9